MLSKSALGQIGSSNDSEGDGTEKVRALLCAVTHRITTMQLRLLELSSRIEILRGEMRSREDELRQLVTSNRMMVAEFNMIVDDLNKEMLGLASAGLEQDLITRLVLSKEVAKKAAVNDNRPAIQWET